MFETLAQAFLEHGAIGLLALTLLWLYVREKSEVRRLNALITQMQDTNRMETQAAERALQEAIVQKQEEKLSQIDEIRLGQIQREQEFAETIQSIGAGTLNAIDKCETIADELRRLHNERSTPRTDG